MLLTAVLLKGGGVSTSLAGTQTEHTQATLTTACSAGITIGNDGIEYAVGSDGNLTAHALGRWLDKGSTSVVWVRATVNAGSVTGTTGTWLATTTSRSWTITDTTEADGAVTANVTIELALDSAGSTIIDTATYDLSADFA